ncbi:unnamed protein product, partial [Ectocarpus fasciculatus]
FQQANQALATRRHRLIRALAEEPVAHKRNVPSRVVPREEACVALVPAPRLWRQNNYLLAMSPRVALYCDVGHAVVARLLPPIASGEAWGPTQKGSVTCWFHGPLPL